MKSKYHGLLLSELLTKGISLYVVFWVLILVMFHLLFSYSSIRLKRPLAILFWNFTRETLHLVQSNSFHRKAVNRPDGILHCLLNRLRTFLNCIAPIFSWLSSQLTTLAWPPDLTREARLCCEPGQTFKDPRAEQTSSRCKYQSCRRAIAPCSPNGEILLPLTVFVTSAGVWHVEMFVLLVNDTSIIPSPSSSFWNDPDNCD